MEDRRTLGSLISVAALCAAALTSACGSTPKPSADDGVPLPTTALAPPDGADDVSAAASASAVLPAASDAASDATAPTNDPATTTPRTTEPGGAAPRAEEPEVVVPSEPPRWFPEAGTVIRLAGISPADDARLLEVRTIGHSDGESLAMEVVVRSAGEPGTDIARERYLVTVTGADVRIELAPDGVRDVPRAVRELPRPPVAGAAWRTPESRCVVEAVDQDVVTFKGTRPGCVRVRVTTRTGRSSTRWFDPQLGEIRREVHDRRGKLIAAWALCDDAPPADDRYAIVLLGQE